MIPLTERIAEGQREQQSKNCIECNAGDVNGDRPRLFMFFLLFYAAENKNEAQC